MMKYVIDRIEDDIAVCETEKRQLKNIPLNELYSGAKEGDWFQYINDKYLFLVEETISARNKNILLQKQLFEE